MSRDDFNRIAERELTAANAKADRDDAKMIVAARGEPFFTDVASGPVHGLAEFLSVGHVDDVRYFRTPVVVTDGSEGDDEEHSCTQCGWSGTGFHACPGLPGENEW
jgi:hypothetical protein